MRIAGKSADISQNVRFDGLFQKLMKSYMGFYFLLEVLQAHCVPDCNLNS